MISQVLVKFFIEFREVSQLTTELPIQATVWVLAAGWLVALPLGLQGNRRSLGFGAVWGLSTRR
jgi:hypothetical protein